MKNNYKEIKDFTYQDITSIIFVIASVLNIIASDKEKEYVLSNNKKDMMTAYNIYIIVLIVLIVLYLYFLKGNYKAFKNCSDINRESYLIRLIGSILFLIGSLCFLYFRIDNKNKIQSSVEI